MNIYVDMNVYNFMMLYCYYFNFFTYCFIVIFILQDDEKFWVHGKSM